MDNREWLQEVTNDSQEEIAEKIHISRRTLQNQIYGQFKAETVIKIAEVYRLNPHIALHDLGFIAEHWLTDLLDDRRAHAAALTEFELGDEVLRRMLRGVETDALTAEVTEIDFKRAQEEFTTRPNSNTQKPHVAPLSDDEIAEAIREANEQPQAAHPADETEYTEPDHP